MNKYTIYCTSEQVKKALELGAPIIKRNSFCGIEEDKTIIFIYPEYYSIPTADQMICWLEEQRIMICTSYEEFHEKSWSCEVVSYPTKQDVWVTNKKLDSKGCYFNSRKEATLSAIDTALECLSKAKEK